MTLSDDQVELFRKNGYLRIPQLIEMETVQILRDYYDRILRRDIPIAGDRMLGGLVRQVMVPSVELEYFRDNPALRAARQAAQRLLDSDDVAFFFDMLISKEPGQLNETPWHNDYAYSAVPAAPPGRISSLKSVQFWVALDDVDEETGCMEFAPGSHLQPSPAHHVAGGAPDDPGRLLAATGIDVENPVVCPLPAGGCTVHSTGTLHRTGGNRSSERQRRAYIFNFRRR